MTDKVQKIREEVERLKSQLLRGACSSQVAMETRCKEEAYNEVLTLLNAMLNDALSKETKESWNERLDKNDFRERYKRIAQSESFKKAHEGISIGDAVPVEGEEPVSKVWHDATEKCVGDKDVLFHSAFDNRWYVLKVGQLNQNIVDKWAYIEDILKL